jgi:hypothetical protein
VVLWILGSYPRVRGIPSEAAGVSELEPGGQPLAAGHARLIKLIRPLRIVGQRGPSTFSDRIPTGVISFVSEPEIIGTTASKLLVRAKLSMSGVIPAGKKQNVFSRRSIDIDGVPDH